jgi:TonB-linked SusC/RagA family outer membrane protein
MRNTKKITFKKTLFTIGLLLFISNCFSQNINLNFKNKPLSTVIKSIETQTEYRILFNTQKINNSKKITISITNGSIEEVLNTLTNYLGISYQIKNKQVVFIDKKIEKAKIKERIISGVVKDKADNSLLPGASISVKGTAKGAITDFNGKFSYIVKSDDLQNLVLVFSYLGHDKVEIKLDNTSYFEVFLEENTNSLSEIVITSSYGTKKLKEEVVGSISTLKSEDIAVDQASESIDKMVDGQIAGVLIENTSGIGGPVKINIRGQGSLSSNGVLGTSTQPLIIIDGVIITEEIGIDSKFFQGTGSFSEDFSNPLSQISPENIESFTVLKDAAAVSIYGADGANGVIIITTKAGKKGKTKFGFATQLGVSTTVNDIKYLNGAQYNKLRNEYLKNTGANTQPYNNVNTDWFNLLNGTGVFKKYSLNASGGISNFTHRTSLSYLNIEEPQLGNNTKQINGGINLGYNKNKFSAALSLLPSYSQKTAPNIYYSYAFVPTLSPYNEDGSFSEVGIQGLGNPLAAIAQNKNQSNSYGLFGSINFSYDVSNTLKFSSLFGLDFKDKEQDRYFSGENESGRASGSFELNDVEYPSWGRRVINNRKSFKWNWQGQAIYNKKLDDNNTIDGLVGFELSEEKTDVDYAASRGFVNPNIINNVEDAIQDDDPETEEDETTTNQTYRADINNNSRVSFYSQLNYDYKKRYYILVNFRRDESSVFGDDSNVAYNGGVGLAWTLSNENFLENTNWIDFLKLKASYGTTGNSRIGSYRSKGLYTFSQNGYNGLDYSYINSGYPPNAELSWEKNKKFNIGLDFNFLNRVNLTLEYYHDNLEDLITTRSIPTETGYDSVQLNAATMYNRGFELSTNFKWFTSDSFKWATSFNISTLQNKITNLIGLGTQNSVAEDALSQRVGHSTSTIWGVNYAGIDPATGRELIEKDGEVYDAATYNSLFNVSDWVPIGDRQPDAFGGFNNKFSYKDIHLSIRGSFQIGGEFLVQDELISKYNITSNRNMSVNAIDFWSQQGDNALQPVVLNNPIIPNLSKFLYNATFLRISNINLNYNVPTKNIHFIDALSLFVDISNVAYWYKEKSPKDRNGIREFRFSYPQARTISLGLNTKF